MHSVRTALCGVSLFKFGQRSDQGLNARCQNSTLAQGPLKQLQALLHVPWLSAGDGAAADPVATNPTQRRAARCASVLQSHAMPAPRVGCSERRWGAPSCDPGDRSRRRHRPARTSHMLSRNRVMPWYPVQHGIVRCRGIPRGIGIPLGLPSTLCPVRHGSDSQRRMRRMDGCRLPTYLPRRMGYLPVRRTASAPA